MSAAILLLLAASLAAAAPGRPPGGQALPPTDAVVNLDHKMDRLEPLVKTLAEACQDMFPLEAAYADGRDPDDPALRRAA
ncbi:MAG: hypothetical protein HYV15_04710, partial [Elusimicrobia bacterium]|nr:hypothetical protein [Elusimicrobiota bacterium]